jgi:hypothetical protein
MSKDELHIKMLFKGEKVQNVGICFPLLNILVYLKLRERVVYLLFLFKI